MYHIFKKNCGGGISVHVSMHMYTLPRVTKVSCFRGMSYVILAKLSVPGLWSAIISFHHILAFLTPRFLTTTHNVKGNNY